ncbi:hypothetical protein N9L68_06835 [bacterium]|nr:hypothetical protein [bacterium]
MRARAALEAREYRSSQQASLLSAWAGGLARVRARGRRPRSPPVKAPMASVVFRPRAASTASQRDGERNLTRALRGRAANTADQRDGERNVTRVPTARRPIQATSATERET